MRFVKDQIVVYCGDSVKLHGTLARIDHVSDHYYDIVMLDPDKHKILYVRDSSLDFTNEYKFNSLIDEYSKNW